MIKEFFIPFIQQYGPAAIFLSLLLEYIGFPVPGETAMTFIGFLSWKSHSLYVVYSLIFSVAGSFAGSQIAWFLGKKYGESILLKYGKLLHLNKKKLDSASAAFVKHKVSLLLFGRYVPGMRHLVPYMGGISGMSTGSYIIYNLLGSLIWCTSFIGLGYALGEKWSIAEDIIKGYTVIFILLIVFIFVVIKFFNKHKKIIFAITFPMMLFVKLCEDLLKNELTIFDNTIYQFITRFFSEDMTEVMRFITYMGSGLVLIAIAIALILRSRGHKKFYFYSWMLGVNLVLVAVLNEAFKIFFQRERPDILRLVEAAGFSFPSGHSMVSASFYGLLAYMIYSNCGVKWKYLAIALFSLLVFSIGISRIYLGVHFASDVLAGFSAGIAWLGIFIPIVNRIYIAGDKPSY